MSFVWHGRKRNQQLMSNAARKKNRFKKNARKREIFYEYISMHDFVTPKLFCVKV